MRNAIAERLVPLFRPRFLPLIAALLTAFGTMAWAVLYFYPNAASVLPRSKIQAASFGHEAFAAHQVAYTNLEEKPSLIIVGGSSMIEALVWPDDASKHLSTALAREVPVVNLSTGGQTLLGSFHIVLSVPIVPGSVVAIHTNIGRFRGAIEDIPRYLKDNPMLFFDWRSIAAIDPNVAQGPTLYDTAQNISAWVPTMLRHQVISRMQPQVVDALRQIVKSRQCGSLCASALKGGWFRDPTSQSVLYEYDRAPMSDPAKRDLIETYAPHHMTEFVQDRELAADLLIEMNRYIRERGARLVVVHLPQNPDYETRISETTDLYDATLAEIEQAGAVVLNYSDRLNFEPREFYDHTHMLPSARAVLSKTFLEDIISLLSASS